MIAVLQNYCDLYYYCDSISWNSEQQSQTITVDNIKDGMYISPITRWTVNDIGPIRRVKSVDTINRQKNARDFTYEP